MENEVLEPQVQEQDVINSGNIVTEYSESEQPVQNTENTENTQNTEEKENNDGKPYLKDNARIELGFQEIRALAEISAMLMPLTSALGALSQLQGYFNQILIKNDMIGNVKPPSKIITPEKPDGGKIIQLNK